MDVERLHSVALGVGAWARKATSRLGVYVVSFMDFRTSLALDS